MDAGNVSLVGIESDQVVYEYLSRVGDLAQQRQLPSSDRMRLVSGLREEIDRRRAKAPVDSPASVRRILDRIGTPDEVVAGADPGPAAPEAPRVAVPVQRDREEPQRKGRGLGRLVPRPRPAEAAETSKSAEPFAPFPSGSDPVPPHLAGTDELGNGDADWWLARRTGPLTEMDSLPPGFVGGLEIPDLLKRPPRPARPADAAPEPATEAHEADAEDRTEDETQAAPRRRPRLRIPLPSGRWSNPLLLLAAALLVVGAVLGNLYALLVGWAIAYASRRLTQAETKWAVVYLPAAAVAAGVGWLWGRTRGRWGEPIAEGHMNEALTQTWPWVLRGAAIASALFLVWRSQRSR
ncbi:membrane protein [Streptomyces sp. NRRL WC-3618]|nr:membrane protein [Streptomyces sp. NRRL WC-3618]